MNTKVENNAALHYSDYAFESKAESSAENSTGSSTFKQCLSEAQKNTDPAETTSLMQQMQDHEAEMREKIKNGEIEDKIQIGGAAFTVKQWNKVLKNFDKAEDKIEEAIKEEIEKKEQEKKDQETNGRTDSGKYSKG